MRPENAERPSSTSASLRPLGSPTGCSSPSASSVAVVKPKRMSATWVLGSFSANSASRVADSKRIGSTPVASGSSVPACPTRWAPVSRRSRLTTVNEVSPAALSTLRIPVGKVGTFLRAAVTSALRRGGNDRLLGGRQHHSHCFVHRTLDLRTGGADMTAASERSAQRGGVHGSTAAHADFGQRVVDLLEEDGELEPRDAVERVDDALGFGHHSVGFFQHSARHLCPRKPSFHLDSHGGEGYAAQLERGLGPHLVNHRRDATRVGTQAGQPGGVVQRARRRVLVTEAAGVGEQGDIEVGRHRLGDRIPEVIEHLHDHLAHRRCLRLDDVDIPEPRVRRMVVDVDDRRVCRNLLDAVPGAFEISGIEEEHQLRVDAVWRFGLDVFEAGQKFVHLGKGRRDEHPHVFARGAQSLGEREAAPERVAVGILVTEDQDPLVGVDELLDLAVDVGCLLGGSYDLPSPPSAPLCGSTSFNNSLMWTLYSIEESSSKRISGENLRFCSLRPSSWRIRPLADTSPASDSFCCSGFPSTLTRTRADLRSGDMRTDVMLTNPIRGSFSSRRMMDMISSRTCSPTWSAR